MAVLMTGRAERTPTLFDLLEEPAAAPRDRQVEPAGAPDRQQEPAGPPARSPDRRDGTAQSPAGVPGRRGETGASPAAPGRRGETGEPAAAGGAARHGGVGGESTLDDLLVGAWEGLVAQAAVACPLCDGMLRPVYGHVRGAGAEGAGRAGDAAAAAAAAAGSGSGGGAPVIGGRCDRCGTTVS